jgi:hypothetical protein
LGELSKRPAVAELDLRGTDPVQALKLLDELWDADTGRVLVTDETELLLPHAAVFVGLQSPLVGRLLCVAVGRPPDGTAGLELPGALLAGQDAGLLWVPDPDGHDWRLAGSTLAARRDEPGAGLARLRELLRVPEVFDRTAELAAAVPGGVSNPGLRLATALPDDAEFPGALLTAICDLLEPGAPPALTAAPVDPGGGPEQGTIKLRDGSPLHEADQRAEHAVTTACQTAERLGGPFSLFLFPKRRPAARAAVDAGQAMADVRSGWARLFTEAPVDAEPLPGQSRLIRNQGVHLSASGEPEQQRARTGFGAYIAEGLAQGSSLGGLTEGLREQKRFVPPRLTPQAELDRTCPPDLVERLRECTPLPPPEPWLPAPGLVAAGLGGLGAFGAVGGAAIAVIYTLLVALTVLGGPGARHPGGPVWIAATGAASSVGAFAAAAGGVHLPGPLGVIALLVALAGAVAAVLWSWRSRCRRWPEATGLEEAPEALADLRATVARLASSWSRAAHRHDGVADLMRATAAIEGVREALRDHAETLRARGVRTGARTALVGVVRGHLNDLVRAALEPRWQDLPAEMPRTHQDRASAATADLIAAWERHVTRHGALEPPFAADPGPSGPYSANPDPARPDPARHDSAGPEASPVSEKDAFAIRDDVAYRADAVMWQLFGPGDLPLLRSGDGRPPCVRFAPRATRAVLYAQCPADTLWVRSSRHAGVLRLVPVRPELVRQRWHSDND